MKWHPVPTFVIFNLLAPALGITSCGNPQATGDATASDEAASPNVQNDKAAVAIPEAPAVSDACAKAFHAAAGVSKYQERHEDLFPAYSACTSVLEWKAADESNPNAIDGIDPVSYAMTVCANNQRELGNTPICRAVSAPAASEPSDSDLRPSAQTALLGVPIPEGAQLIEQIPADSKAGRDPSERYAVSATAPEIADFFNREMTKAGWAKDGTSTETALFFRKRNMVIGILMNRKGGTFTLMGS